MPTEQTALLTFDQAHAKVRALGQHRFEKIILAKIGRSPSLGATLLYNREKVPYLRRNLARPPRPHSITRRHDGEEASSSQRADKNRRNFFRL